jgi:4a-hydroxytetrahydrobiopterin dehydratase
MTKRVPLSESELSAALKELPGWAIENGKLSKTYRFSDFVAAWAFMSAAALHVQQLDHHPEWFNVYSTVRVDLVTHDAGGITARDVELAGRMESVAGRAG